MTCRVRFALAALFSLCASPALADPIEYIFTGTATGYLQTESATSPFSEAPFTLTAFGTTSNDGGISHALVDVGGVGTFPIGFELVVDVQNNAGNYVELSNYGDGGSAISGPTNAALATWDLKSNIGPISGATAYSGSSYFFIEDGINRALEFDSTGASATFQAIVLPAGDMNSDGVVDSRDINAMIAAITGGNSNQFTAIGDVNGDGVFNNADLQALLDLLKSGGGGTSNVPEPSSFILLALASAVLLLQCRR